MMNESEIKDKVRIRLKGLGFSEYTKDTELIEYFQKLIFDEITTNINWTYIPEKLESVYIDMIAGEYLYSLFLQGKLTPQTGNGGLEIGNVTSIKAGDMTLGINGGDMGTSTDRLLELINRLRNPQNKRYLFDIVRKALI